MAGKEMSAGTVTNRETVLMKKRQKIQQVQLLGDTLYHGAVATAEPNETELSKAQYSSLG
jgi:hypothetical protein